MHELLIPTLFYIFAGLAIISALLAITQNNPVRCVLFLVLTFLFSAVLWLLLEAEFLALILILVYVGAVMTLFLFVVMMLNIDVASIKSHMARYLPFGLILVALLTGLLMVALPKDAFLMHVETAAPMIDTAEKLSNTEALGMVLYTDYVLAFEMAAVLLLVAIIAAITLAHRSQRRGRTQNIVKQVMTRPEDRVVLVNLKSEP